MLHSRRQRRTLSDVKNPPGRHWPVASVLAPLVLALAACGGGGNGGGGDSAGPSRAACDGDQIGTYTGQCLTDFETRQDALAATERQKAEFQAQWGLTTINLDKANAALSLVESDTVGQRHRPTIGVIDTGVAPDHPLLKGARITETLLQGVPDEKRSAFEDDMDGSHGTAITSIIAARPLADGSGFLGVFPGANFRVYGAKSNPATFDFASAFRRILRDGADILNNSWGVPGTFAENYEAFRTADRNELYKMFPRYRTVAQLGVANPTIFVWAAGNSHGELCDPMQEGIENCVADSTDPTMGTINATSPLLDAGVVALIDDWQGHNVVVVSVNSAGTISHFSNRCGIAANWCIAAPGEDVVFAFYGKNKNTLTLTASGTSFAAPMVAGGLGLMKQMFRGQLSNPQLVTRLFATANKTGNYATASIYGQGLMDIGAAVSPVGVARVQSGGTVGRSGPSVQSSRLQTGGAFGDGIMRATADREMVAFDALGAPFWFDLPAFVTPAPRRPLSLRLRELLASESGPDSRETRLAPRPHALSPTISGWRIGLGKSLVDADSSLFNLAQNATFVALEQPGEVEMMAFVANAPGADGSANPNLGGLVSWQPGAGPVGFRAGWLAERGSMLGSDATGAFGRLSAQSIAAGIGIKTDISRWRVGADAEVGMVRPTARDGVIDQVSSATTTALSLRAGRRLGNRDDIAFLVSQPPRVERGTARMTLPVGCDFDRRILRESFRSDLEPSGRQIDLSATWTRKLDRGGEFLARTQISRHPGHVDTEPEASILAGWRTRF